LGQPVVTAQPNRQMARDMRAIARALAGVPVTGREGWLPWRRRHAWTIAPAVTLGIVFIAAVLRAVLATV